MPRKKSRLAVGFDREGHLRRSMSRIKQDHYMSFYLKMTSLLQSTPRRACAIYHHASQCGDLIYGDR